MTTMKKEKKRTFEKERKRKKRTNEPINRIAQLVNNCGEHLEACSFRFFFCLPVQSIYQSILITQMDGTHELRNVVSWCVSYKSEKQK